MLSKNFAILHWARLRPLLFVTYKINSGTTSVLLKCHLYLHFIDSFSRGPFFLGETVRPCYLKCKHTLHNYIPRRKSGIYWIQVCRRRRRRRRNFLVDAITQKQINFFFSNLVHMLRVPKGRSLF